MKVVPLVGAKAAGRVALVDDADYDLVTQYRWHASFTKSSGPYAYSCSKIDGRWKNFSMHSLITGWAYVDHRNHDTLDNRRENLRAATHAQNGANMLPRAGYTSRHKGVYWSRAKRKWRAQIRVNGKSRHLGYFLAENDAALAYQAAAQVAWGPFAEGASTAPLEYAGMTDG